MFVCVHQNACVEARRQFVGVSPLCRVVLWIELSSSGMAASTLTLWTIRLAPSLHFERFLVFVAFEGVEPAQVWGSSSGLNILCDGFRVQLSRARQSVLIYSEPLWDFNQDTNIVTLGFWIGCIFPLWVAVEVDCEVNQFRHIWGFAQVLSASQGSSRKQNLFWVTEQNKSSRHTW